MRPFTSALRTLTCGEDRNEPLNRQRLPIERAFAAGLERGLSGARRAARPYVCRPDAGRLVVE
jgi:hypothetical protein